MTDENAVRDQLRRLLDWEEAHVNFDTAVAKIPVKLRGSRPRGLPYSSWQLIEHLRIAQHDILDFCRNPDYKELKWPDDYWPSAAAPPSSSAWDKSIRQFRKDRKALQQLAADTSIDLGARIPHGSGQTYLRELVLAADHAAYHIGELVLLRRLLGIWKTG
jgi:DinB family protein